MISFNLPHVKNLEGRDSVCCIKQIVVAKQVREANDDFHIHFLYKVFKVIVCKAP